MGSFREIGTLDQQWIITRRVDALLLVDGVCLQNYLGRILQSVPAPQLFRFFRCSRHVRQSVLARMCGFEQVWPFCPWPRVTFMNMLLDNEALRHPRVWLSTWVAMSPPDHLAQLPHVAEWLRNYTEFSAAPRLTVVIRGTNCPEKMRYEEWILWEPCLREQRVLAYRAQPCGLCACCGQPSFWKMPRGRRGCAASIMRTVGPMVSGHQWPEMTSWLSRTKSSPLEHLLSDAVVNMQVFETLFFDAHCLSCSCGTCSLRDLRAGLMCPHDQSYVELEREGPESPRDTNYDLSNNPREVFPPEDIIPNATRVGRRHERGPSVAQHTA